MVVQRSHNHLVRLSPRLSLIDSKTTAWPGFSKMDGTVDEERLEAVSGMDRRREQEESSRAASSHVKAVRELDRLKELEEESRRKAEECEEIAKQAAMAATRLYA